MKAFIKQLFFDQELVDSIKASKADPAVLYTELLNGKITLREYMAAL